MDPITTSSNNNTNPLMPPAKEKRILLWRNEVAYALVPQNDTPSLTSSSSHTSSSAASAASLRGARGLWRRLSSRLSIRSSSSSRRGAYADLCSPDGEVNGQARMAGLVDDDDDDDNHHHAAMDEMVVPGQEHSSRDGGARGGLKDKQDRLRRAARLLHQSVYKDERMPLNQL